MSGSGGGASGVRGPGSGIVVRLRVSASVSCSSRFAGQGGQAGSARNAHGETEGLTRVSRPSPVAGTPRVDRAELI